MFVSVANYDIWLISFGRLGLGLDSPLSIAGLGVLFGPIQFKTLLLLILIRVPLLFAASLTVAQLHCTTIILMMLYSSWSVV